MDDSLDGARNKRGDWTPSAVRDVAPFWHWPPRPVAVLRWLPGYLGSWNLLHFLSALAWWAWVVPDVDRMKTVEDGWVLRLLAANWLGCLLFYGAFEWRLYRRRSQERRFKYHAKFPAEQPSDVFWFKNQTLDNFLRSFLISIPLWTVVQVIFLWLFATGRAPWLSVSEHPLYLALLTLLVPAIHELHFYVIHRAMHWAPVYRWVHSIHHNSVNSSPFSSLSMHPVEGFLYHAVALWHVVIPSNPMLAMFQLHLAGFGAINGHIGFEKVEVGRHHAFESHAFLHHLHHKHFDVNFGGDGLVPLDLWFGSWHDGSQAAEQRMHERYQAKLARMNARAG